VEKVSVRGAALEGNLEGDNPARDVYIYLPPSYASSRNQRYPVVYLLHGYGLTAERWMSFTNLAAAADKNIAAGTMQEMILVNPDAFTKCGGSPWRGRARRRSGPWPRWLRNVQAALAAAFSPNPRTRPTSSTIRPRMANCSRSSSRSGPRAHRSR